MDFSIDLMATDDPVSRDVASKTDAKFPRPSYFPMVYWVLMSWSTTNGLKASNQATMLLPSAVMKK